MAKAPLSKEERLDILNKRLKSLNVLDQIVEGEMFDIKDKEFIPTGVVEIDTTLGEVPGFVQGKLIELIGDSGSGKTYLALKASAEAQKKGLKVAFFNVENSFYEPRAQQIGVQTRDKSLFQLIPNLGSGETICNAIIAMIESELYGLIVVDSITALIPNDDLEKDFDDPTKIGGHARLVGNLGKKLTYLTERHNTSAILINQFRIGAGSIPNTFVKTPTGGHGLRYYAHYRLEFRRINGASGKILNQDKEVIGGKTEVKILKSRYGKSGEDVTVEMPVLFEDQKSDTFVEFINRAKAKNYELIKEVGQKGKKKFQYITEDGEVIESQDPIEFIDLLKSTPAPEKRTRGDNSTTAFEYICRKIKFTDTSVELLEQQLELYAEKSVDNSEDDEINFD